MGLRGHAGFCLVAADGGSSSAALRRLLIAGASRCRAQAVGHVGFSSGGSCLGSGAQAQSLWHSGSVAPWRGGSSQTKDRTHVSCISRSFLYH